MAPDERRQPAYRSDDVKGLGDALLRVREDGEGETARLLERLVRLHAVVQKGSCKQSG